MIILFFIIVLQLSFGIHVAYLIAFLSKKDEKFFKGFLVTAITNIFIGGFLAVFVLISPREMKVINLDRLLFLESGVVFIAMLAVKARISIGIYRKTQDPAHYHMSYFGKKVIHSSAVSPRDLFGYFLTLPLTLICGAYFVAKLGCFR